MDAVKCYYASQGPWAYDIQREAEGAALLSFEEGMLKGLKAAYNYLNGT